MGSRSPKGMVSFGGCPSHWQMTSIVSQCCGIHSKKINNGISTTTAADCIAPNLPVSPDISLVIIRLWSLVYLWFLIAAIISLGRLLRVHLMTLVGLKCPSVHLSTKSSFDFNEIWCVGRGRRVMHDGMQYDPIRGQCHEPVKVGNSTIFKGYFLHHL